MLCILFFITQLLSSSDILDLKYRNGTATLSINEVYPEDEGLYKCKATNSLGTAETTCRLTVQSKSITLMFELFPLTIYLNKI
jgi:hypothetical protein